MERTKLGSCNVSLHDVGSLTRAALCVAAEIKAPSEVIDALLDVLRALDRAVGDEGSDDEYVDLD